MKTAFVSRFPNRSFLLSALLCSPLPAGCQSVPDKTLEQYAAANFPNSEKKKQKYGFLFFTYKNGTESN